MWLGVTKALCKYLPGARSHLIPETMAGQNPQHLNGQPLSPLQRVFSPIRQLCFWHRTQLKTNST